MLNQTPIRGQRIGQRGERRFGDDDGARSSPDVLAQPFIVMRNDHQDALSAGSGGERISRPPGKSAEEIRGLWQWVAVTRLNGRRRRRRGSRSSASVPASPDIVPAMFVQTPAEATATVS